MINVCSAWIDFSSWGLNEYLAQGFGLLAVVSFVISYLQKDNQKCLWFQLIGCIFWCLNFIFLGALGGLAINIVGIFRVCIYLHRRKFAWARHWAWYVVIFALLIGSGVLSYLLSNNDNGLRWTAVLPVCAYILTTISLTFTNTFHIRIFVLISDPFWILYDVLWQNLAGILNDVITLVAAIVGIIVIDIIRKRREKKALENKTEQE